MCMPVQQRRHARGWEFSHGERCAAWATPSGRVLAQEAATTHRRAASHREDIHTLEALVMIKHMEITHSY